MADDKDDDEPRLVEMFEEMFEHGPAELRQALCDTIRNYWDFRRGLKSKALMKRDLRRILESLEGFEEDMIRKLEASAEQLRDRTGN